MLRLASDENFHGAIVRGLLRRLPSLDILRVQDVGLMASDDPTVLEWAASEMRTLLTHDRRTIPRFAYERVRNGQAMPGVFVIDDQMPIGQAIDEILLTAENSSPDEWQNLATYFPLGTAPHR